MAGGIPTRDKWLGSFHQGEMGGGISPRGTLPGGRWLGEFHQGADSLDHLARGQIAGGFSPGAKYLGAPYQGIDG